MSSQGQNNINVPRPGGNPVTYTHQSPAYSYALNQSLGEDPKAGPYNALATVAAGQPGSSSWVISYTTSNTGATQGAPSQAGFQPNPWGYHPPNQG